MNYNRNHIGLKIRRGINSHPHTSLPVDSVKPEKTFEPQSPDAIYFDGNGNRVPELKLASRSSAWSFIEATLC